MINRIEEIKELKGLKVAFWIYSKTQKSFHYISPNIKGIFENNIDKITDIRTFRSIIHPEDQTKVLRNLNGGLQENADSIEYRIITSKGKVKWLKNTAVLLPENSTDPNTVIGTTYILTKKKSHQSKPDLVQLSTFVLRSLKDSFILVNTKNTIVQSFIKSEEKVLLKNKTTSLNERSLSEVFLHSYYIKVRAFLQQDLPNLNSGLMLASLKSEGVKKRFETVFHKLDKDHILFSIRSIADSAATAYANEKFYALAEQSPQLIVITDTSGKIEYNNPSFSRISGYTRRELKGKNMNIIRSKKYNSDYFTSLWKTILSGKTFIGDFHNSKKNGISFIEEKTISPLFDRTGSIINFVSVGTDVTKLRRQERKSRKHNLLQLNIEEKEEKNRTLSLIKSNELERQRLAKEIHEDLNQMLSAVMANIESFKSQLSLSTEEKVKLELINDLVSDSIQELRAISGNLYPGGLYKFGLHPVLLQLTERLKLKHKSIVFNFTSSIKGLRFRKEIEINLYRIIQEILHNSIQHANPKKITIQLHYVNNKLKLVIKDDGTGINLNNLEYKKMSTFGILNTEARAKSLGAVLKILTQKDKGFKIEVTLITKTINL